MPAMKQPTKSRLRDTLAKAADTIAEKNAEIDRLVAEVDRLADRVETLITKAKFSFVLGMLGGAFAVFMGLAGTHA